MNFKNIVVCLMLLMIGQTSFASRYGSITQTQTQEPRSGRLRLKSVAEEPQSMRLHLKPAVEESLPQYETASPVFNLSPADKFIEKSYIFPSQQAAICGLFGQPLVINQVTGAPVLLDDDNNQPRNWPTIAEIMSRVNGSQRDAVLAVKLAIDFAIESARLTFGYEGDGGMFNRFADANTKIMKDLAQKKAAIEKLAAEQRGNYLSQQFNDEAVEKITEHLTLETLQVYTSDQADKLISKHDFKHLVNTQKPRHAAELLFQECYTALEGQFLKEEERFHHILRTAKQADTPAKRHQKLIAIAMAVDLADFIAQNEYGKSWYNPTRYVYANHPLLKEITTMKADVKKELVNPHNGATQADIDRQYYLDLATDIAVKAGILAVTAAVILGAVDVYNNYDVRKTQANDKWIAAKALPGKAVSTTYNAAAAGAQKAYDATLKPILGEGTSKAEFFGKRSAQEKAEFEAANKTVESLNTQIKNAKNLKISAEQINGLESQRDTALQISQAKEAQFLADDITLLNTKLAESKTEQETLLQEVLKVPESKEKSYWSSKPKSPQEIALANKQAEETKLRETLDKETKRLALLQPKPTAAGKATASSPVAKPVKALTPAPVSVAPKPKAADKNSSWFGWKNSAPTEPAPVSVAPADTNNDEISNSIKNFGEDFGSKFRSALNLPEQPIEQPADVSQFEGSMFDQPLR